MLEVEGGEHEWCMRILRHEAGHAIDNAYRLRLRRAAARDLRLPVRRRIPSSTRRKPYSKSFVLHLDSWYAQSHPDEDFAETFAVWLTPNSEWRQRYAGWPALEEARIHGRADAIAARAARRASTIRRRSIRCATLRTTLRQHYRNKRRHYGVDYPNFYDRDLRRLFSDAPEFAGNMTAAQFIARIRRQVRRVVAELDRHLPVHDRPGARGHDRALPRAEAAARGARGPGAPGVHRAAHGAGDELPAQRRTSAVPVKKLRVLALVHDHLVPPDDTTGIDILEAEWKMEYDVIETLREIGHEVRVLGIHDDLGGIRADRRGTSSRTSSST